MLWRGTDAAGPRAAEAWSRLVSDWPRGDLSSEERARLLRIGFDFVLYGTSLLCTPGPDGVSVRRILAVDRGRHERTLHSLVAVLGQTLIDDMFSYGRPSREVSVAAEGEVASGPGVEPAPSG